MEGIESFVTLLKALPEVDAVILFGSLASNTMTEASDIDIAVLIDEGCDQRNLRTIIADLKRSCFTWPTDLIVMKKTWFETRKSYGGLCLEINATGKWLYARGGGE